LTAEVCSADAPVAAVVAAVAVVAGTLPVVRVKYVHIVAVGIAGHEVERKAGWLGQASIWRRGSSIGVESGEAKMGRQLGRFVSPSWIGGKGWLLGELPFAYCQAVVVAAEKMLSSLAESRTVLRVGMMAGEYTPQIQRQ
jgi:hypothetical protein